MDYLKTAKNVLTLEANALIDASNKLTEDQINHFLEIIEFLRSVGGNLIFCGVGKSGVIATKLATTFSSLGLPSFFLHPVEALHGDLGRVTKSDAIVFLSKSGTTSEIINLLPFINIKENMRLGLLGNTDSTIARECGIVFDCSVEQEACINDQAPTTSSTLALAMGDALAVVYESFVGLSKEGFAQNHPGGLLGKSLRLRVKDLMWKLKDCPTVAPDALFKDVILEMTKKPVGGCAVVDKNNKMLGIFVEGDIRRTFVENENGVTVAVTDVMNADPVNVGTDELAFDALKLMEQRKNAIDILPVIDEDRSFLGFIRLHDLLKEGFVSGQLPRLEPQE